MFDEQVNRLGLGTYSLTGDDGIEAMTAALDAGYRHVDTARLYENEAEVGEAIEASSVDREELVVATKIGHFEEPEKTPDYVRNGVEESLEKLGVDTIDLLYHHWPRHPDEIDTVLPVFEELYKSGTVEHLGVSNYRIEDVERATDLVDVPLYANQVEMHPLLPQEEPYEFCREQDLFVVAYSPLAQGEVFDVPEIVDVAEKHDTSPAVVSLAWLLSHDGVVAIPRSSSPDHIEDNLAARDLELDEEDLERIDSIDDRHRYEDPDWMEW
ncbi:aldo/keto reductase [Halalkalicoccus sp. GCM10025322]|uniref:aldo/keto reductase n=1 Tax=Halalkalicoccus TaxID=332246 RepID=UPI002F963CC2